MTDQQLLADYVAESDGRAFEAVVRRHGPMVLRVCRDVLSDPLDAEDAFQATFLVLVRQAGSIRDHASLGRWLCEVAWRISRRERRRMARLRSQERQAQAMDPEAPPDLDPADREMKPILHDEIRRLPARLRDPVLLCYFEGLSVEEAARRLGVPLGTFKSRIAKAREVLRSRLTRRGLAASALLLLMFSLTDESAAAVPDRLIDATLGAGVGGSPVSAEVAAMVRREESRWRLAGPARLGAVLVVLLVGFGAVRLASARISPPAPPAPAADPRAPDLVVEDAGHCKAR